MFSCSSMVRESEIQKLWGDNAMVTQDEHPALAVPFFFVHPCETANMMKLLNVQGWNYVLAWWSWIAPTKGVRFPALDRLIQPVAVSLIIPCFNCAKFVEETIVSIGKQTFAGDRSFFLFVVPFLTPQKGLMEAVFCDDGSSDGSLSEIQKLCEMHLKDKSRFVVTILQNKVNSGAGFARNRCIEAALGEFFCFVDCDDVMEGKCFAFFFYFFFVFLFCFREQNRFANAEL